eukprot:TRINITY_DN10554_c0_g1_i1.p1 TRINITY_DN10554_c0_g1~~TRINITY_DN10554_c0_g1_i1.p1  ORF type:complete len:379 (+),score=71.43 TRINITY_DN10554_c0_g1_i1:60-1139(+)
MADESVAPPPSVSSSKPTCCIVIGMAGSGKTVLVQRLTTYVQENNLPSYVLNLDPAVKKLPYGANIDIRDTVDYKEVMKQYQLGPNGGILTSLNLFATRFDQVMNFVEKRADSLKHIFLDTPGQIEIFTWSASGAIITETLASSIPTVLVFVIDTPRTSSPITFMSNMMYACSIMYKTKLPLIIAFNKTDIMSHEFALNWIRDFDSFEVALNQEKSYMSTLTRSMSFALDEFYKNIRCVGISAVTGEGMDDFFAAVASATEEYNRVYRPHLQARIQARQQQQQEQQAQDLERLSEDLKQSKGERVIVSQRRRGALEDELDDQDAEGEEQEEEEEEIDEEEKREYEELMQYLRSRDNAAS